MKKQSVFIVLFSHEGLIDNNPFVTTDEGRAINEIRNLCTKHFPTDFEDKNLSEMELHEIMVELRDIYEGSGKEIIYLESELELPENKDNSAFGFDINDIINRAEEEENVTITENQAKEIQARMIENGDVGQGISWDTVDQSIKDFLVKEYNEEIHGSGLEGDALYTLDVTELTDYVNWKKKNFEWSYNKLFPFCGKYTTIKKVEFATHNLITPEIQDEILGSEHGGMATVEVLICKNTNQWMLKQACGDYYTQAGRDSEGGTFEKCVEFLKEMY